MAQDFNTLNNYYMNYILDSSKIYRDQFLEYANDAEKDARNLLIMVSELNRTGQVEGVSFTGINEDQMQFEAISDLRNEFDAKYHYLFDKLSQTVPNEFNKFINDFFPKPENFDKLEKFLVDSVFNGSIGLPPEIQRQIWEEDRARINIDNERLLVESRKSVSSKGFMLPTGVETYNDLIARNQASRNISISSTKQAVDESTRKIEWVKFAVSEARNYRTLALESGFKYLASVLSVNDPAFRYASGYVDSYKTFYDTVNTYYNSVNTVNRLNLEKAQMIDNRNLSYDKMSADFIMKHKSDRTSTLTELARSMGTQAAAALSGINALYSTNLSTVYDAVSGTPA